MSKYDTIVDCVIASEDTAQGRCGRGVVSKYFINNVIQITNQRNRYAENGRFLQIITDRGDSNGIVAVYTALNKSGQSNLAKLLERSPRVAATLSHPPAQQLHVVPPPSPYADFLDAGGVITNLVVKQPNVQTGTEACCCVTDGVCVANLHKAFAPDKV